MEGSSIIAIVFRGGMDGLIHFFSTNRLLGAFGDFRVVCIIPLCTLLANDQQTRLVGRLFGRIESVDVLFRFQILASSIYLL